MQNVSFKKLEHVILRVVLLLLLIIAGAKLVWSEAASLLSMIGGRHADVAAEVPHKPHN